MNIKNKSKSFLKFGVTVVFKGNSKICNGFTGWL